jgi:hypothetical protein
MRRGEAKSLEDILDPEDGARCTLFAALLIAALRARDLLDDRLISEVWTRVKEHEEHADALPAEQRESYFLAATKRLIAAVEEGAETPAETPPTHEDEVQ